MSAIPRHRDTQQIFLSLLTPSWLSSIIAIFSGILIFSGPLLIAYFGGTLQQSILGLRDAYGYSELDKISNTISNHFLANAFIGNSVLFILWGFIGIIAYLIAESIVRDLHSTHDVVEEFNFVHINRFSLIRDIIFRSLIRIAAVAAWYLLFRFLCYKLIPYAMAAAHICAYTSSLSGWTRSIVASIVCMLIIHGLTILLRLMVLHPRLFDNEGEE